ncbi:unnamed protein product [Allacma fusca]|uniref:Uncharacterized protein n=1 Tax=Allacma fusca TaxID=39272 RepID=A0A8J2L8M2_9HEXA|nr:unnamed protein product [Allacma fusca]
MFSLVDFAGEKDKDGTIPCEVVHFKWLSQDLKKCFWPRNKNYIQEFKRGGPPLFGWEECKVKTKFVSSVLSDVREFRAKHLNSTATDLEMDLSLISREIPTVMSEVTLTKILFKSVLTKLTRIERKVDDVSKAVDNLRVATSHIADKPECCPELPLVTVEDLDAANLFVQEEVHRKYLLGHTLY